MQTEPIPLATDHVQAFRLRHLRTQLGELRKSQLFMFTWMIFDVLHRARGIKFIPNWHIEAICHFLQQVISGDTKRLLITVPPRHLKTICSSVALPAFLLGNNPAVKIIIASYGYDLTGKIFNDLKMVFDSSDYKALFPNTKVTVSGGEIKTSSGGSIKATSVGGAITGHGADYIIIDDLMKAADAASLVERDRAKDFVRGSLLSRFDNKQDGRVIAIQQRLHEDDVAAMMIDSGTYLHLNLPAIAEEVEDIPLGQGRVHHRPIGDILFPQSQPRAVLDAARKEHGSFFFQSQYQQNPVNPEGNRINWANAWGCYEEIPERNDCHLVVQSWDTGLSAEPGGDFSACSTWGLIGCDWYLLDVFRQQLDYNDLKQRVLALKKLWVADKLVIENAALGRSLLRELRIEKEWVISL